MRETWAHAVLARLTYWTQQRSDTGQDCLLTHTHNKHTPQVHTLPHLMMHLPTVAIVAKSQRRVTCYRVKSRSTIVRGEVSSKPSNGPHSASAPLPPQLLSAACLHVQLVFYPGTGPDRSVLLARTAVWITTRLRQDEPWSSIFSLSFLLPCVQTNGSTISIQ